MAAASQVLTTPELIRFVCEYCSSRENYDNALVSKTWSNEALSVLWRDLESLDPLLKLLAPLKVVEDDHYAFKRHIRASDWETFQKYSWRVHSLRDHFDPGFGFSTFLDIAMSSRPSTALLPNLRQLSYHDDEPSFRFIPLLIPTSLNYLQLHLMHDDTDKQPITSRDTLVYLPKKAMKLEHLVLTVWTAVKAETADKLQLNVVLPALPELKLVEISPCLLTPSCLRALARLHGLQSLTIPRIEDRTQPSLNVIRSPDSSYKPRALRSISVSSYETEGVDSFTRLLDVIALAYPTVEDISLTSAEQTSAISSDRSFSVLRQSDVPETAPHPAFVSECQDRH
ncbi:hypothetical protein EYR40_009893 [Pleurotus pulmonarius]|nr:hypothetical protein EYR40_009893 [Pleurotus pulmonarius]